ncbi:MAG: gamma-glutamyl-gamma-aminobutyrate hydrolase family protein [Rubrobacteraceae bacterium]|uniref:gamma-glutamyl-gamma-aminobutyrate hydrolase family protein n=1 Tax=Rubrobacter naiadicus TaxID=1392641 RepID=UPI002361D497|nr:gamma-glutamyl-gamma-aminobutyrate hydrolase family protein [Rubrobacter naiadicus]MBX6763237.1 gamma-glutamyl-gamma-aminobutyrate hydrolase family protein [Rubrobacteraceae bacterium]MCL6438786.1 gamma-glutamyl-gamma-aminobutyrate hydrolase family protein [Rubrobacteraceae bacterium]
MSATLKDDTETVAERPLGRFVRADLDYVQSVVEAGGVPVVLPPVVGRGAVDALLGGIDGLLLSGGSDLDPSHYGEERMPETGTTLPERDAFELALAGRALEAGLPVLGICRGLQVLNVLLGGSLYQDLHAQFGEGVLEHRQKEPKWVPAHEVEIAGESLLGRILGKERLAVNSYHHQAVKEVAGDLRVSARSPDGVVEALEWRDGSRWVLGIQWHAEAMREAWPEQRRLFSAFVEAAGCGSGRRAA